MTRIDGVFRDISRGGDKFAKLAYRFFRECRRLETGPGEGIGGRNTSTAASTDNAHPATLGGTEMEKSKNHVRHLLQGSHLHRPALPEEGLPDVFASGEGARMRCHRPCPRLRQAPLHDDDGLYRG